MGAIGEETGETADLEGFFAVYPLVVYEPGERVVRSWELVSGGVAWVRSGVLRMSRPARGGREVTICHLVVGRYRTVVFGLAPYMRSTIVEALTRIEVRRAPRAAFLEYAAAHPGVYRALAEGRLRHMSDLYDQLWAAKLGDATLRVAATLLHLCAQAEQAMQDMPAGALLGVQGRASASGAAGTAANAGGAEGRGVDTRGEGGERLTLAYPLTQRELADLTGLARETVGTALATLRRKGLVTGSARTLRVESMAALRAEVERSS